ncbi:MAG TPA: glycoside hydrolase family 38 C-terminal domain-containing protein [Puia sp.]|uniref:glycoside hydrolase family 38 N-terminal domain-containing protein n=1 Tax=Puia sp. TaxID=2045100 RepID=UPI002C455102|nr:glycoside hydrolase family 38 C-terminal domain-containing protein [Puia sp.]HVU98678.1 glycoside hydrolase family 38 C-terminal domain-containing protein [Puia sp.]
MKKSVSILFFSILFTAAHSQGPRLDSARGLPFLAKSMQSVALYLSNPGDSTTITIRAKGAPDLTLGVGHGARQLEFFVPEVKKPTTVPFTLATASGTLTKGKVDLTPVRKMTIYILPHSHNDIGYTEIQTNVERKQMNNLLTGIDYARRTKDYPAGARFVWNLEGIYAADLFLHRMSEQQRQDFINAVKDGGVALNGMYVNTLTGLCRPEELLQLFHRGGEVAALAGMKVDAAMISDVPGYTWGTVTAMAQAGIKYFSAAPNYFDRIGDILQQWEDKPFYWVSPSGKEKVLVWIPYKGYALSHGMPQGLSKKFVDEYIAELKRKNFNYDISYIRWSGHGDNAVPDITISDFVKEWNTTYTWPKFIISSTSTAFSAFEQKYGSQLPQEKGDWTGYWEDGAASSAFETAENRATSYRLSQAEALWAMTGTGSYPADKVRAAWKNTILYSEHTWGADVSVTRPLSQKTMEQWIIKKSYATEADSLSLQLLDSALPQGASIPNSIDIYNTNSWPRTDLILLSHKASAAGDKVTDAAGNTFPSQRLSTGELAFVAKDIPAFASRRYFIGQGAIPRSAAISIDKNSIDNGIIKVVIDPTTGAITSLKNKSIDNEFVDTDSSGGLNDYLFLPGNNLKDLQRNGPVTITVKEQGPVLAELRIESKAPGVEKLVRDIRLVNGFDYVEMTNVLDKLPAELDPHPGDYRWANLHGKESLNFGFPFHVKEGTMRLDIPMAIMQPEKDQIPGSCKNWLEVGSWADVSNADHGITWVTLDAPLVEVGGITATLLGGQSNPAVWRKHIEPTQKLYSWALNNHWETNYRAYQDGIITFRYALQPHRAYDPVASTKLATGLSQPLIITEAKGEAPTTPRVQLSNQQLVALVLKPSTDGKAWILTLFNPSEQTQSTTLSWNTPVGGAKTITVAPQDVITLRVEKQ